MMIDDTWPAAAFTTHTFLSIDGAGPEQVSVRQQVLLQACAEGRHPRRCRAAAEAGATPESSGRGRRY